MKRRLTKTQLLDRMPRAFRPKLPTDQILDLALAHVVNVDTISRGEATEQLMWDWVGGLLMWSRIAEQIEIGIEEMNEQIGLTTRLVERYGRTSSIVFTGPDYQLAKVGLDVMEQLSRLVDIPTAIAAADWAQAKITELASACQHRVQTPAAERMAA